MKCMSCDSVIEAGEKMYRHNNYTDYVICADCYEDDVEEKELAREDVNDRLVDIIGGRLEGG